MRTGIAVSTLRGLLYHRSMGIRNYLVEGVSGTGKTSVCTELQRRGYHAVNGDRELAYQGDQETGLPMDGFTHAHDISAHHIWNVEKVKALARISHRILLEGALREFSGHPAGGIAARGVRLRFAGLRRLPAGWR